MCKVLMIAGLKEDKVGNAWKFVNKMAVPMGKVNDDGIGYAAMTKSGALISEKWVDNKSFGVDRNGMKKLLAYIDSSVLLYNDEYESFGDLKLKNKVSSIILHTRKATTPKGIKNTHPFIRDDSALIHNGVIQNYEKLKLLSSTCDSESILNEYLDSEVNKDPSNFDFVASALKGSYACGMLTKVDDKPTLDIFKNSGSSLCVTFVDELDTAVFATSEYDLKEVLKDLNWNINPIVSFASNHFIRLDAISGKTVLTSTFVDPKDTFTRSSGHHSQENTDVQDLEEFLGDAGLAAVVTEFIGNYNEVN